MAVLGDLERKLFFSLDPPENVSLANIMTGHFSFPY